MYVALVPTTFALVIALAGTALAQTGVGFGTKRETIINEQIAREECLKSGSHTVTELNKNCAELMDNQQLVTTDENYAAANTADDIINNIYDLLRQKYAEGDNPEAMPQERKVVMDEKLRDEDWQPYEPVSVNIKYP